MDLQVQKDKGNPFLTQISLELNEINEEHKAGSCCVLVAAPLALGRQAPFVLWLGLKSCAIFGGGDLIV